MLFNSFQFLVFFPAVTLVYFIIPQNHVISVEAAISTQYLTFQHI